MVRPVESDVDPVLAWAERAREPIRRASGMEPDFSAVSLAAVDHYVRELSPGPPDEMLVRATELGCYFGEVLRQAFGGTWRKAPPDDPKEWTLELAPFPLSVHPIGMAAEALYEAEVADHDGSLHVPAEAEPALENALLAMGQVTEEYYYSLTGRFETIEHVLDILCAARGGKPSRP
jgi:hypothetical protein